MKFQTNRAKSVQLLIGVLKDLLFFFFNQNIKDKFVHNGCTWCWQVAIVYYFLVLLGVVCVRACVCVHVCAYVCVCACVCVCVC